MNNDIIPADQPMALAVPAEQAVDLRAALINLPVEQANLVMAEYKERRTNFREWLRSQLVEGVHFGYPPGLQPRFDNQGNVLTKQKDRDGNWKEVTVRPHNWTSKPSLYKAGADFICDLLAARDEYKADLEGWQQLGSPKGMFVYGCYLHSRATNELLGEGRGCRGVGQKGGDENNALKMAKKSSKVDAVLNTWGLSDLFTQDVEDDKRLPPEHENPERDPATPKNQPRDRREKPITKEDVGQVYQAWAALHPPTAGASKEALVADFTYWVEQATGQTFPATKPEAWTRSLLQQAMNAAKEEQEVRQA